MNAIIVDDEPKAIELLKSYLAHFRAIRLCATFRNGLKAFEYINEHSVDIAFLDINMPHLTGTSLAKMVDAKIKIVFTTAYSEYAVESYEIEAVDYLLKPIGFERFSKAISKILSQDTANFQKVKPYLMVKSGSRVFKVEPEKIIYLKKDGNYMIYYMADKHIMARESVSESLNKLPDSFMQVHKSFIINLHKIDFYDKTKVNILNASIPISTSFKEVFLEKVSALGI